MNKMELVAAIADKSELSKADATRALDALIVVISKALKKSEEVRIVGFGTFAIMKRKAGTGRNPRTGEEIKIPARKRVRFKPGKQLNDDVNK